MRNTTITLQSLANKLRKGNMKVTESTSSIISENLDLIKRQASTFSASFDEIDTVKALSNSAGSFMISGSDIVGAYNNPDNPSNNFLDSVLPAVSHSFANDVAETLRSALHD